MAKQMMGLAYPLAAFRIAELAMHVRYFNTSLKINYYAMTTWTILVNEEFVLTTVR